MEDVREDMRFTTSLWKTWIQREMKVSQLFSLSSNVFQKTTKRSGVLAQLAHVFPENTRRCPCFLERRPGGTWRLALAAHDDTRRGAAVAVVSWSAGAAALGALRDQAALRREGSCKHHGDCPLSPHPALTAAAPDKSTLRMGQGAARWR